MPTSVIEIAQPKPSVSTTSDADALKLNQHHPFSGLSPESRERERVRDFAQVLAAIVRRLPDVNVSGEGEGRR